MNILNKKEFCDVIQDLKENEEFINKINDVFNEFRNESNIFATGLENTVVKLLEIMFEDTENQWIAYWIWERWFGEDYEIGDVTEADGTVIPLRTAEDLYDFLIKNMKG
jgi:hypothetical protein